ncbi:GNAT family N-acetyltransferase [Planctomycetota bacterium]|nr:GNAT family N-acetyltransferase [Planctomycetota bacterium]
MIRSAVADDIQVMIQIAEATKLFKPQELEEFIGVVGSYFEGRFDDNHCWLVDEEDGGIVGVVYIAPEPMTYGVWNTYFIAVIEGWQHRGKGRELMDHVEGMVKEGGGRLLMVETSSLAQYENAWGFYRKCGYDEEARIRDFYDDGEDKLVFRKKL